MNALALKSIALETSRGNALGAYFTETRFELTRMVRNPGVAIPVLAMPIALYALFALVIFGEAIDKDANVGVFMFWAFSLMAVTMPALFATGVTLALERDMGLLRLKRAQPAPPAAWVVAKIVSGLTLAVLAYTPIVIVAFAAGKLSLDAGQVATLSGALLVGTIPFCALGLMIGSLVSGPAASSYALLVYLPGCYLSGMFFPLPRSMDWQASIWPQFHVKEFAMHLAGIAPHREPLLVAIAVMLGCTVTFAGVTIWRLKQKG
jgi:ABC-2 type transport system permease protein